MIDPGRIHHGLLEKMYMKKTVCPKCKSENVIPVRYGEADIEAIIAGRIKPGSHLVNIDGCKMPDKYCKDCKYEWSMDHFVAEDIVKVRFRYWNNFRIYYQDESTEEGQWAFEILSDGIIKYYSYPSSGRRVLDKMKVIVPKGKVTDFYNEVIWLYRPWTVIEKCMVSDGSSYELTITYKDNRKRKFHGDVGGGTVDNTVIDFLKTIPELAEKI